MLSLDPAKLAELERRRRRLGAFFDLSALEGHGASAEDVKRYYEESWIGYRFAHSKEGAMHMALNPSGTFDASGYEGQAKLVRERLGASARAVLELACGNGYNLELLAALEPSRRFAGIDLVDSQIRRADKLLRPFGNVTVSVGNFQELAFADGSQDVVFAVESFCHATDLGRAFDEVRRVLRPGGHFVVIDAWRTDSYRNAPESVQQTAATVELAMAVSGTLSVGAWKETAERHGLMPVEDLDLSEQIKPNLGRLAKGADRFLSHRRLAVVARTFLPRSLIENVIAGYLMPVTVDLGVHTYRLVTLERSG